MCSKIISHQWSIWECYKQPYILGIIDNIIASIGKYGDRFRVSLVPNITNICYGRDVGYKIQKIILDDNIQKISATSIRNKLKSRGKL